MALCVVSSCLLGYPCRYDARSVPCQDLTGKNVRERLVPVCPEVLGGLGVPRPPAEIVGGEGKDVLDGRARVVNSKGEDVTGQYIRGSMLALGIALQSGAARAILRSRSPACGVGHIYDGSFSRRLREGDGVFAALLRRHGLAVHSDAEIQEVLAQLGDRRSRTQVP